MRSHSQASVREFLSKPVRIVSLYVFALMAFGLGVLVSSARRWEELGVAIGSIIVLFGSVYGVALFSYVGWRMWRNFVVAESPDLATLRPGHNKEERGRASH
jgi:hypothetical protein